MLANQTPAPLRFSCVSNRAPQENLILCASVSSKVKTEAWDLPFLFRITTWDSNEALLCMFRWNGDEKFTTGFMARERSAPARKRHSKKYRAILFLLETAKKQAQKKKSGHHRAADSSRCYAFSLMSPALWRCSRASNAPEYSIFPCD